MNYRRCGRTGLLVSELGVGTVSLGMDYGIRTPDSGPPTERQAIDLLAQALDAGINFFDTAPAYGAAEHLLGKATGRKTGVVIATKITIPRTEAGHMLRGQKLSQAILASLENSLQTLGRDTLDVVQIHNATPEIIAQGEITEVLLRAKGQGKIRYMGVSVYGEEAALSAIQCGHFDTLQVAYNVLDQSMRHRVFPAAQQADIGLLIRSVFLKGVLSEKAQWLPPTMSPIREAAEQVKNTLQSPWKDLSEMAIRFCLASPAATLLIGAKTLPELTTSLAAAETGPLPKELAEKAASLAMTNESWLNPSNWPLP